MRAVVAGGRGFIGRHVCAALARAAHAVRVVGRGEALGDGDVVIHLGLFDEATAAAAAREVAGRPLVVASSGDVYFVYDQLRGREPWDGVQPGPLAEDAPLRTQLYPYGRVAQTGKGTLVDYDKILVERAVLPHATVLRLPKVHGDGDPQPVLGATCAWIASGRPVPIAASVADWRWTFGRVDDIAHAFVLAAAAGRTGVYNVGEAVTPTWAERVAMLGGEVARVPADQVPRELALPIAQPVDLVLDTAKIRRELGYAR
jgi:nucleoside-diphosphate-sugar epimerase